MKAATISSKITTSKQTTGSASTRGRKIPADFRNFIVNDDEEENDEGDLSSDAYSGKGTDTSDAEFSESDRDTKHPKLKSKNGNIAGSGNNSSNNSIKKVIKRNKYKSLYSDNSEVSSDSDVYIPTSSTKRLQTKSGGKYNQGSESESDTSGNEIRIIGHNQSFNSSSSNKYTPRKSAQFSQKCVVDTFKQDRGGSGRDVLIADEMRDFIVDDYEEEEEEDDSESSNDSDDSNDIDSDSNSETEEEEKVVVEKHNNNNSNYNTTSNSSNIHNSNNNSSAVKAARRIIRDSDSNYNTTSNSSNNNGNNNSSAVMAARRIIRDSDSDESDTRETTPDKGKRNAAAAAAAIVDSKHQHKHSHKRRSKHSKVDTSTVDDSILLYRQVDELLDHHSSPVLFNNSGGSGSGRHKKRPRVDVEEGLMEEEQGLLTSNTVVC